MTACDFDDSNWDFTTALLWIAFRDPAKVRAERPALAATAGIDGISGQRADFQSAMVRLLVQEDAEALDLDPESSLLGALRRGAVKAVGRRNGDGPQEPIDSLAWSDSNFSGLDEREPAVRGGGVVWTRLWFDKASIVSAFPGVGFESLEPGPREKCPKWVLRPDVHARAHELFAQEPAAGPRRGFSTILFELAGGRFGKEALKKALRDPTIRQMYPPLR